MVLLFLEFIDAVNSIKRHIENEKRELDVQLLKHQKQQNQKQNSNALLATNNKGRSRSIGRVRYFIE